jgi:serine protease Do
MICVSAVFADSGFKKLYDKLLPASVEILAKGRNAGSGSFVSADGLVLTASHIFVANGEDCVIEVLSRKFGRLDAELIEMDRGHDLALLKVKKREKGGYPFLKIAKRNPSVGTEIYSVSTPIYIHNIFNKAVVASDRVDYQHTTYCDGYAEVLYIITQSPRGSSGGVWVNAHAEIVGVQSGWVNSLGRDNDSSGINFIGPASAIADFIKRPFPPEIPWLGVLVEELWTQSSELISEFPPETYGLIVSKIEKGGPFDVAGGRKDGVITHIDGHPVSYRHDLLKYVRTKNPGEKMTLRMIYRKAGVVEKRVELARMNNGRTKR